MMWGEEGISDDGRCLRSVLGTRDSGDALSGALRRLRDTLESVHLRFLRGSTPARPFLQPDADLLDVLAALDRLTRLRVLLVGESYLFMPPLSFRFRHLKGLRKLRLGRALASLEEALIEANGATLEVLHCGARSVATALRCCTALQELRVLADYTASLTNAELAEPPPLPAVLALAYSLPGLRELAVEAVGEAELERVAEAVAGLVPPKATTAEPLLHLVVLNDGVFDELHVPAKVLSGALRTVGRRIRALTLRLGGVPSPEYYVSGLHLAPAVRSLTLATFRDDLPVWLESLADPKRRDAPSLRRLRLVADAVPLEAMQAMQAMRSQRPEVSVEVARGLLAW